MPASHPATSRPITSLRQLRLLGQRSLQPALPLQTMSCGGGNHLLLPRPLLLLRLDPSSGLCSGQLNNLLRKYLEIPLGTLLTEAPSGAMT